MAEIGYCYGSEWQLMRFLGHHRKSLDCAIKNALGVEDASKILWEDYPFESGRNSGDGEHIGIELPCLQERGDFSEIKNKWKDFWPQSGSAMNWDGVFTCDGEIVLVESKAHVDELDSKCKAEGKSKEKIEKAFVDTKRYFGVDEGTDWTTEYYQKANRLAFVFFLNEICHIKARLLNIYFLNGFYSPRGDKNVKSQAEWQKAIGEECEKLGIKENDKIKKYVSSVFVDCAPNGDQ